jgi:hypothetical protein
MSERESSGLEKQVVRLADGRRLIFYRFGVPTPPPEPGRPPPEPREGAGPREG